MLLKNKKLLLNGFLIDTAIRSQRKAKCNAFSMDLFVSKIFKIQGNLNFLQPSTYFLAKEIFMACEGVILKPPSASLAAPLCTSEPNSTKAIS